MADYTIDRRRYPLAPNGAGQVQVTCAACGEPFDAGAERVKAPAFLPLCSPACFTCGHHLSRTDLATSWCSCGWFTTAREFPRRFRTHVQRCTGEAAA